MQPLGFFDPLGYIDNEQVRFCCLASLSCFTLPCLAGPYTHTQWKTVLTTLPQPQTLHLQSFERYRAVERKHGRIAMMAMAGVIVHNNNWIFDGYLSPSNNLKFSDISTGVGGLFQVPAAGLAQILLVCGLVELGWWPASKLDGDYGIRLGKFNNWARDPERELRQKNSELNNGRAAMMGITGNFFAELFTGQTFQEQAHAGHFSPFGDGQGFF